VSLGGSRPPSRGRPRGACLAHRYSRRSLRFDEEETVDSGTGLDDPAAGLPWCGTAVRLEPPSTNGDPRSPSIRASCLASCRAVPVVEVGAGRGG